MRWNERGKSGKIKRSCWSNPAASLLGVADVAEVNEGDNARDYPGKAGVQERADNCQGENRGGQNFQGVQEEGHELNLEHL